MKLQFVCNRYEYLDGWYVLLIIPTIADKPFAAAADTHIDTVVLGKRKREEADSPVDQAVRSCTCKATFDVDLRRPSLVHQLPRHEEEVQPNLALQALS